MPPNINRYLLRSVDIDAVSSAKEAFIYVKLPYIMLVGFIQMDPSREWQGTKVNVRGLLESRNYVLPGESGDYIFGRACRMKEVQDSISEAQKKKVDAAFWKMVDSLPAPGTFKAMQADVQLFGTLRKEKND